ncbi:hypothetical protein HK101_009536 [Irineochytrium annulatum]|nr:hypothetical protein HK101_009536 [Irineochytrium annulatum]
MSKPTGADEPIVLALDHADDHDRQSIRSFLSRARCINSKDPGAPRPDHCSKIPPRIAHEKPPAKPAVGLRALWTRRLGVGVMDVAIGRGVFHPDGPLLSARQKARVVQRRSAGVRMNGNGDGKAVAISGPLGPACVVVGTDTGTLVALDGADSLKDITLDSKGACVTSMLVRKVLPFAGSDIVVGDSEGSLTVMCRQRAIYRKMGGAPVTCLDLQIGPDGEPEILAGDAEGSVTGYSAFELRWRSPVGGVVPHIGIYTYAVVEFTITQVLPLRPEGIGTDAVDCVVCCGHFAEAKIYYEGELIPPDDPVVVEDWIHRMAVGSLQSLDSTELVLCLMDSTVRCFKVAMRDSRGILDRVMEVDAAGASDEDIRKREILKAILTAADTGNNDPAMFADLRAPRAFEEEDGEIDEGFGNVR